MNIILKNLSNYESKIMDDYWAGGIVVWMQSPLSCGSGKWKGRYGLSAFTSPGEYAGKEVTVMLDGKKPFEAKVVKAKMPIERVHRMRFLPDEEKLM